MICEFQGKHAKRDVEQGHEVMVDAVVVVVVVVRDHGSAVSLQIM